MPSERSLFRKMQIVIESARAGKAASIEDLCQRIKEEGPTIFNTSRYVPAQDAFLAEISLPGIRRAVRLCLDLELLTDQGVLTQFGREAARKSRFSNVLGDQVLVVLERNGVKPSTMNAAIRKKLRAEPVVLPTSDVLWDELKPSLTQGTFSKLLTLLIHCERGQSSQKKVYLNFLAG